MNHVDYDEFRIDYGTRYGGAVYAKSIYEIDGQLIAFHYTIRTKNGEYYIDKISTTKVFKEFGIYLYGNTIDDDVCGIKNDIEYFEKMLSKKKMSLLT